jgi:membrane protease YdiL (CAAX protease family)
MLERVAGLRYEDHVRRTLVDGWGVAVHVGWRHRAGLSSLGGTRSPRRGATVFDPEHPYRIPELLTPAGDLSTTLRGFAAYVHERMRGLRGIAGHLTSASYRRILFGRRGSSLGVANGAFGGKRFSAATAPRVRPSAGGGSGSDAADASRPVGTVMQGYASVVPVLQAAGAAASQVALLGGVPFLAYLAFHRWRCGRRPADAARRAGVRVGRVRYVWLSSAIAVAGVAVLAAWRPPMDLLLQEGSAYAGFAGLGLTAEAVALALLYGVVKTGFTEELLFRGLIAGSLARRLPAVWANVVQATVFLLPHLAILLVSLEAWPFLPLVFGAGLLLGWLRIVSGSILGPWIVHASVNVATAMLVAVASAG